MMANIWEIEYWKSLDTLTVEYILVGILAVAVVGYILYGKYKDRKRRVVIMQKQQPAPVQQQQQQPQPQRDFVQVFGEEIHHRDILVRLDELGDAVITESKKVDTKIEKDFSMMRKELVEVHTKREQLKTYGLKLARLYEKYGEREYELTLMMSRIEEIMNRQKELEKA